MGKIEINAGLVIGALCSLLLSAFVYWATTVNSKLDKANELQVADHLSLEQVVFKMHYMMGDVAAAPVDLKTFGNVEIPTATTAYKR